MAQSRLEKIGTVYSRIRGLLETKALRAEQTPLWYDVYEAFPPKYEPRWDRKPNTDPLPKILYQEDVIRAKFYHKFGCQETLNLLQAHEQPLTSQVFINKYLELLNEGHEPQSVWDKTIQALELEGVDLYGTKSSLDTSSSSESATDSDRKPKLSSISFQELFAKENDNKS
uniref:Small ribosomal subunit protein mS23 n=1 Tax=Pseudodiaptomus poplesia TaxID=213370 RepID=A0A0U2UTG1_9MAXI|nr:mitochondrial 28S ribosomal protein S23 [Pseudodiaptomus poplesia]